MNTGDTEAVYAEDVLKFLRLERTREEEGPGGDREGVPCERGAGERPGLRPGRVVDLQRRRRQPVPYRCAHRRTVIQESAALLKDRKGVLFLVPRDLD